MELIGYTSDDLAVALNAMESNLQTGESAQVNLYTYELPDPSDIALAYLEAVAAGFKLSYPQAKMVSGVPTISFVLTKTPPVVGYTGHPFWALLVPILGIVAVPALIAFGIFKAGDISNAIMPILLVAGGIIIITAALLAKPATKYLERGGKIPGLLPATEDAEHLLRRLDTEQKDLWNRACDWDKIPRNSKFIVFSPNNPYAKKQNEVMGQLMKYRRLIQAGGGLQHRPGPQSLSKTYLASTIPKALAAR